MTQNPPPMSPREGVNVDFSARNSGALFLDCSADVGISSRTGDVLKLKLSSGMIHYLAENVLLLHDLPLGISPDISSRYRLMHSGQRLDCEGESISNSFLHSRHLNLAIVINIPPRKVYSVVLVGIIARKFFHCKPPQLAHKNTNILRSIFHEELI